MTCCNTCCLAGWRWRGLGVALGKAAVVGGRPIAKDPAVKAAIDAAKATEAQTIADQIRFCEIPAPTFKEEVRGQELKRAFTQLGLQNVRVDKVGNVLGDYPGAAPRPRVVIAAHLDTVFPEGTDVKVKREGNVLKGPGIGDDCRGLAVMVAIVREMKKANVKTPGSTPSSRTSAKRGSAISRYVAFFFFFFLWCLVPVRSCCLILYVFVLWVPANTAIPNFAILGGCFDFFDSG